MKYFTVLTTTGANKIAAATAANETINLTHIAVGDSNGTETAPVISQTQLINEVYRTALSEKKVDENNSNHIIASSTVPADQGNFWIREVGVFDEDGDLIAVGNYPETYKSILTQGAAKEVILRVVFEVANTEVVSLQIDPSIVMASQEFVNEKLLTKADKDYVAQEIAKIDLIPSGMITMWSGTIANIPNGFFLCDGNNGTPNLKDKFVMGTTIESDIAKTGGSPDAVVISHSHTANHNHTASSNTAGNHQHKVGNNNDAGTYVGHRVADIRWHGSTSYSNFDANIKSSNAGNHSHSITVDNKNVNTSSVGENGAGKNLPPYFKLAFIMKG